MTNINNYDLFLFDLDGTLINTEDIHYQSYLEALINYGYQKEFTFNDYCRICHLDDIAMQQFVELNLNIVYEKFYQTKKTIYLSKLNDSLCLINGFDKFLSELKRLNKKTCIVTHSSRDTIDFILEKLPILKGFCT
jgi:beta-phosphoglucomutase-like phosphatase (HAD superfamily)